MLLVPAGVLRQVGEEPAAGGGPRPDGAPEGGGDTWRWRRREAGATLGNAYRTAVGANVQCLRQGSCAWGWAHGDKSARGGGVAESRGSPESILVDPSVTHRPVPGARARGSRILQKSQTKGVQDWHDVPACAGATYPMHQGDVPRTLQATGYRNRTSPTGIPNNIWAQEMDPPIRMHHWHQARLQRCVWVRLTLDFTCKENDFLLGRRGRA